MLSISSSLMSICKEDGEEMGGAILDVDDINFDDLFVGFDDGDILPDLEIDSDDIFADFSFSSGDGEEESGNTIAVVDSLQVAGTAVIADEEGALKDKDEDLGHNNYEVIIAKEEDGAASVGENRSGRKKGSHGKKKAKVDWTPELHRRFVQAVEQLGVDKAVPSRILELMGIDCLTRHNIASHLQKYRCHRKHLLAREAEAASWSQRRQMYSGIMKRGAVDVKININPNTINNWQTTAQYPTIVGNGYPPPPPPPPPHHHQMHMHMHMHMQMQMQTGAALMRPLHVWGHPHSMQVDRPQLVPVWPRHLSPPPWLPLRPTINGPPIPDPISYHKALAQGTPCFPPQLVPTMRFQAPPVPGIPPPHAHALFRVPSQSQISSTGANSHSSNQYSNSQPHQLDTHPSNEKIDAAIEDVLAKPWSPLPLGLKPPSLESVMVELQRQGVSNIVPPTYSG